MYDFVYCLFTKQPGCVLLVCDSSQEVFVGQWTTGVCLMDCEICVYVNFVCKLYRPICLADWRRRGEVKCTDCY